MYSAKYARALTSDICRDYVWEELYEDLERVDKAIRDAVENGRMSTTVEGSLGVTGTHMITYLESLGHDVQVLIPNGLRLSWAKTPSEVTT